MKVNFGFFFLPSPLSLPLKNQSQSSVGGSSSEEVQKNPLGCRKRYILELIILIVHFMLS